MRIAITGSHWTGKTAVVEALAQLLPHYKHWPEPYYQLAETGYPFAATPSQEDFEAQLAQAIHNLAESEPDSLFDRCPLDLLAYLLCHPEQSPYDLDNWVDQVQNAIQTLDLIIYVPIEIPDRIALPSSQDADLRADVDEQLRELLFGNTFVLSPEPLEIQGPLANRITQITKWINEQASHATG